MPVGIWVLSWPWREEKGRKMLVDVVFGNAGVLISCILAGCSPSNIIPFYKLIIALCTNLSARQSHYFLRSLIMSRVLFCGESMILEAWEDFHQERFMMIKTDIRGQELLTK